MYNIIIPATSQTTTSPTASIEPPNPAEPPTEKARYQAIASSLSHLSHNTRPDIISCNESPWTKGIKTQSKKHGSSIAGVTVFVAPPQKSARLSICPGENRDKHGARSQTSVIAFLGKNARDMVHPKAGLSKPVDNGG